MVTRIWWFSSLSRSPGYPPFFLWPQKEHTTHTQQVMQFSIGLLLHNHNTQIFHYSNRCTTKILIYSQVYRTYFVFFTQMLRTQLLLDFLYTTQGPLHRKFGFSHTGFLPLDHTERFRFKFKSHRSDLVFHLLRIPRSWALIPNVGSGPLYHSKAHVRYLCNLQIVLKGKENENWLLLIH